MLRVYQSRTSSEAKKYYTDALAKQDYYVDGHEIVGLWHGKAAQRLGIVGQVGQKSFANLCENKHPISGERLTPRTRDDRTVGYDINFHAPKGISLLHALTGDERITMAMREAVSETMLEIEKNTHTRVRLDGKSEDRHTGNLVWGEFVHFTGRPVDGVPDPQTHIHCFVFNATWDSTEMRWKAGQFRQVVRDQPYFQASYHTRLAAKMEAIGYPISRGRNTWDLKGITPEIVDKFSRRTQEIEAAAKRLGITDPSAKGRVGARTRSKKDKNLGRTELATIWQQRLSPDEAEWLHGITQGPGLRQQDLDTGNSLWQQTYDRQQRITPDEALSHAIEHVFARKAVESDRRLVAEALKMAVGHVQPDELWKAIEAHPELLSRNEGGERWMTTRAVLEEEKAVLQFAVAGKGTSLPLGAGCGGREGEQYKIGSMAERDGIALNPSQIAAVEHLMESRDRVMLLRGGAGTGKTTLLREAAMAIKHGGGNVFACAVTTDASRGVLREAGFKGAEPLEKLLTDKRLQERIRGAVIWVDEAGMVGTPTMKRLCDLAEKQDARIVLAGDTKQHAPVERGDGMKLLERQAGIRPAEVTEIIRQRGIYKDAVKALEEGELAKSVDLLDQMGAIKEIRNHELPEERHRQLAERYVETVSKRESALVVSPTHAEGKEVTALIREQLKESGKLDGDERDIKRLQDLQWTDAQKADANQYELGMTVQYNQHCPGVPRHGIAPAAGGIKAKVVGVDAERGLVTTKDIVGNLRPLPMNLPERFQVYREEELKLAVGDQIRITKGFNTVDQKHRLTNGSMYKVAGFKEDGNIVLDNKGKWEIHKNAGHVTHGYCATPQAAQGKSVDRCFAAMSAMSLSASSLEQIYVIASRGKKSVELLTDNRPAFMDAMSRIDRERSATELMSDTEGNTEKLRLMAHAHEVQRLRSVEETRKRMMSGRQQPIGERQHGWQHQQEPPKRRPGPDHLGRPGPGTDKER